MVAHGALGSCIPLGALGPSEAIGYSIAPHVFIWVGKRLRGRWPQWLPVSTGVCPDAAHFFLFEKFIWLRKLVVQNLES